MWRIHVTDNSNWTQRVVRISRMPGWVIWPAIVAAAIVVVVPLIAVTLAALVVGMAVFGVLMLLSMLIGFIAAVVDRLDRIFRGDGRQNVRIIRHDPD